MSWEQVRAAGAAAQLHRGGFDDVVGQGGVLALVTLATEEATSFDGGADEQRGVLCSPVLGPVSGGQ